MKLQYYVRIFAYGKEKWASLKINLLSISKNRMRKHLDAPEKPRLAGEFSALVKVIWNAGVSDCRAAADYVQFIAFSGARKTEASHVTWADIDLARETVRLSEDRGVVALGRMEGGQATHPTIATAGGAAGAADKAEDCAAGHLPTGLPTQATHRGHVWTWDFIADATMRGGALRMLTILDGGGCSSSSDGFPRVSFRVGCQAGASKNEGKE